MAIPVGAIAGVPFAPLGAAALGSSKSGRDMMKYLGKVVLKAAEKPLRNMAGNMLEKAASIGARKIRGGRLDIQKALAPLGELHLRTLPGHKKYNYCGPSTDLTKRLERGDKGIKRLNEVCKQHDIDYDNSDTLADKHIADQKMIDAIDQFPNQDLTERGVKNLMKGKKKLGLGAKPRKRKKALIDGWSQQLADELHKPIRKKTSFDAMS